MDLSQNISFKKNPPSPKYFNFVLTLFISSWLISDILAIKIVSFWGITLTGGFLTFPLTMALSILIVDVYGYKNARQTIWCGWIINLIYISALNIINVIPSAPEWKLQHEFEAILLPHTRIILASIISFWISGFFSSYIMAKLKSRGNSLLGRILFSSFIGVSLDIILFFTLGLIGTFPLSLLKHVFFFAYIKKIICEIILLPLLWFFIDKLKRLEGFEIYDYETNFNPFRIDNIYDISDFKAVPINKSTITTVNKY